MKIIIKYVIKYVVPASLVSVILVTGFYILYPKITKSASNFSSAYASMRNSRFSFVAGITTGTAGSSNITIDTASFPDKDVDHIFPGDTVCFTNAAFAGCTDRTAYVISGTEGSNGDQFTLTTPLTSNLGSNDIVVSTQSGIIEVYITLTTTIPDGGDLLITIPAANSGTITNSFPDYAATVAASGFDTGGLASGDVAIARQSGGTCADGNWSAAVVATPGDITVRYDRSGATCASTAVLKITIGSTNKLVNPAPINTTRTQGVADAYTINVKSRDNTDTTIDDSDIMVAPVEAVLVSATVDETLSFTVAGEASGNSRCGMTTDITTTAMAVPWGTIAAVNTFYEGNQILTLSTNADNGYNVYIEENDQMNKDADACDSPGNGTADYTDGCIKDTTCSASGCSESSGYYWTSAASYDGLGISLANLDGTDATWLYDSTTEPCTTTGGGTSTNFCARQIADVTQASETRQSVMYNAGPVNSKDIYVCYRINISGLQPAGYYYNKVRYTAVPNF